MVVCVMYTPTYILSYMSTIVSEYIIQGTVCTSYITSLLYLSLRSKQPWEEWSGCLRHLIQSHYMLRSFNHVTACLSLMLKLESASSKTCVLSLPSSKPFSSTLDSHIIWNRKCVTGKTKYCDHKCIVMLCYIRFLFFSWFPSTQLRAELKANCAKWRICFFPSKIINFPKQNN